MSIGEVKYFSGNICHMEPAALTPIRSHCIAYNIIVWISKVDFRFSSETHNPKKSWECIGTPIKRRRHCHRCHHYHIIILFSCSSPTPTKTLAFLSWLLQIMLSQLKKNIWLTTTKGRTGSDGDYEGGNGDDDGKRESHFPTEASIWNFDNDAEGNKIKSSEEKMRSNQTLILAYPRDFHFFFSKFSFRLLLNSKETERANIRHETMHTYIRIHMSSLVCIWFHAEQLSVCYVTCNDNDY